jgi:hypothetical protein
MVVERGRGRGCWTARNREGGGGDRKGRDRIRRGEGGGKDRRWRRYKVGYIDF